MAEEDFGAHYDSDDNEHQEHDGGAEGIEGEVDPDDGDGDVEFEHEHDDRGNGDEHENFDQVDVRDVVKELESHYHPGYEPQGLGPDHEAGGVLLEHEMIHDGNGDSPERSEVEHEHDVGYVPEDLQPVQTHELGTVTGGDETKRWPGWPGESVFRMLVPVHKVGGLIGRKGEAIKKLTEETRARIKVLDGPPGTSERAVMVSAKEEFQAAISPAMEGLLRVHGQIIGLEDDSKDKLEGGGSAVTRLLVVDGQSRNLIGKQGSTIKSIQDSSGCVIRIVRDRLPLFALRDDTVVEIQGPPAGVHKAVELISNHLRKFLVDRGIIGVFETEMQAWSRSNQNMMPPQESWAHPQGFGHGVEQSPRYFQPTQYENYYPPSNMPRFDKQQRRENVYGRYTSAGAHAQPPAATKNTVNMQIPLAYADSVIGTAGANISYIRRASGAAIAVQETRGVPGEMTVEISGSASQIQAAEQLIQNFMAEASGAGATIRNSTDGSTNQAYNAYAGMVGTHGYPPYQAEATAYASQPTETTAPAGDYSSMYTTNYGH